MKEKTVKYIKAKKKQAYTAVIVLVSNGYSHYEPMCEQWRFFKHRDKTYPHITVYNKAIDVYPE